MKKVQFEQHEKNTKNFLEYTWLSKKSNKKYFFKILKVFKAIITVEKDLKFYTKIAELFPDLMQAFFKKKNLITRLGFAD